jgi:CRP-like cAMP-binding protein
VAHILGGTNESPTMRHFGFAGQDAINRAKTASYTEREVRAAAARSSEHARHVRDQTTGLAGQRTTSRCLVEGNRLLAAFPAEALARLTPNLALVPLPLQKVLYEPGVESKYVYFPVTGCIVSMLHVTQDGSSAETALVGDEGVVGVALFMGGDTTPGRGVVQSAGHAVQLEAKALQSEFWHNCSLQMLLLRYTQALIAQMAQTAVCNRYHSLEQQLCRWLLRSQDRLPTNHLRMTHELIANMLGVRREGVTQAAGKLQEMGMIRYRRGHITIVDRRGLEACVCECYAEVKKEYRRLLPAGSTRLSVVR